MPLDNLAFWVFAPIAVASAIGMLMMRNAMYAALFLIVNFFCLAVMYLLLDAAFLFAVQIVVYAGAIMVLFLFVIMLLGHRPRRPAPGPAVVAARPRLRARPPGSSWSCSSRCGPGSGSRRSAPDGFAAINEPSNTQAVAKVLFEDYFFPFEVTSVLLIVASIAAMVLAPAQGPRRSPRPSSTPHDPEDEPEDEGVPA